MGPQQPEQSKQLETPNQPGQSSQPTSPKKGLSKGAVWGIVLGSVALVLVIVGVILALILLGPPTKADYEKAYDKTKQMEDDYSDLDINDKLTDAKTVEDIDKIIDDVKARYDKDNNELGGMKAMNDQDVKKAFEEYKKRYSDAIPYLRSSLKSMFSVRDVNSKCGYKIFTMDYAARDKETALKSFDDKTKDCLKVLDDLEKTDDEKVKKFAKEYKDYIGKYRTYAGDYADARGKNDYSAMSKLKYPSASDMPSVYGLRDESASDLEKYNFTEAFGDLQSVLKKKID